MSNNNDTKKTTDEAPPPQGAQQITPVSPHPIVAEQQQKTTADLSLTDAGWNGEESTPLHSNSKPNAENADTSGMGGGFDDPFAATATNGMPADETTSFNFDIDLGGGLMDFGGHEIDDGTAASAAQQHTGGADSTCMFSRTDIDADGFAATATATAEAGTAGVGDVSDGWNWDGVMDAVVDASSSATGTNHAVTSTAAPQPAGAGGGAAGSSFIPSSFVSSEDPFITHHNKPDAMPPPSPRVTHHAALAATTTTHQQQQEHNGRSSVPLAVAPTTTTTTTTTSARNSRQPSVSSTAGHITTAAATTSTATAPPPPPPFSPSTTTTSSSSAATAVFMRRPSLPESSVDGTGTTTAEAERITDELRVMVDKARNAQQTTAAANSTTTGVITDNNNSHNTTDDGGAGTAQGAAASAESPADDAIAHSERVVVDLRRAMTSSCTEIAAALALLQPQEGFGNWLLQPGSAAATTTKDATGSDLSSPSSSKLSSKQLSVVYDHTTLVHVLPVAERRLAELIEAHDFALVDQLFELS